MEKRQSRDERLAEKRKNRKPVLTNRQELAADVPAGYVGRWFNDQGRRIKDAIDGGWDFLRGDLTDNTVIENPPDDYQAGSVLRKRVDKRNDGSPLYAYLMVLEKELYSEDQVVKQEFIDRTAKDIKRGKGDALDGKIDDSTTYVKSASFD